MKRHLLFIVLILGEIVVGQTMKRVGVATETPTETLHVNGTTRITDLPKNGEGKIYTKNLDKEEVGTSQEKDQPFKAIKTLVADKNGVLGTVDGIPGDPIEKCTRGVFYTETREAVLNFKNYRFKLIQAGSGRADLYMRYIGKDPRYNYGNVKVIMTGGEGRVSDPSGGTIPENEDVRIASAISFEWSQSQNGTVIIPVSNITFNYYIRTVNQSDKKVYSFCVEQATF